MAAPTITRGEVQLLRALADTGKDKASPYRDGHRPWTIVRGGQGWKSATFHSLAERGFLAIEQTAFCGIGVSLTDAGRAVLDSRGSRPGAVVPAQDSVAPTNAPQADEDFDRLLAGSSLGSPQAMAIRAQTPAAASERFTHLLHNTAVKGAYDRVGIALDAFDQLGVAVVGDYGYRARLLVADLRVVFTAAAPALSDLEELDIPEAARAALCHAGIGTIAQLTALTRDDLWNVPGLAAKRIDQISSALQHAGTPLVDYTAAARAAEPNGDT